jgi:two-component system response regulator RstA
MSPWVRGAEHTRGNSAGEIPGDHSNASPCPAELGYAERATMLSEDGPPRVMIVEDDPKLSGLVSQFLSSHGMSVVIEERGDRAAERVIAEAPDVVVLDVMLPGIDGFEVCRRVRSRFDGAILMLTARGDDVDEVVGLELGADDYMAKPVRPRVLLARIKGLLRRGSAHARLARRVEVGSLTMDAGSRSAWVSGAAFELTTAEFDLLWFFACRPGEVLTREQIYLEVRGIPYDGVDRSIDLRISRLRKKLGEGATRIKSIRGTGYLLVAEP